MSAANIPEMCLFVCMGMMWVMVSFEGHVRSREGVCDTPLQVLC